MTFCPVFTVDCVTCCGLPHCCPNTAIFKMDRGSLLGWLQSEKDPRIDLASTWSHRKYIPICPTSPVTPPTVPWGIFCLHKVHPGGGEITRPCETRISLTFYLSHISDGTADLFGRVSNNATTSHLSSAFYPFEILLDYFSHWNNRPKIHGDYGRKASAAE
jgi:hypothetical protein